MRREKGIIPRSLIPVFLLSLILLALVPATGVFCQEAERDLETERDFWICPGMETTMYSLSGITYGGGLALGYGKGVSLGLKAVYFFSNEGLTSLELNILVRWYFLASMPNSGPFVQFSGGPVFLAPNDSSISMPAEYGLISAGLSLGWRVLLGRRFFFEPSICMGYPYFGGAGLYAGFRY